MAGYSGTPLAQKLGIKPGAVVALLGAPSGFERALAPVPAGVRFTPRAAGAPALILWFVTSQSQLDRRMAAVAALVTDGVGLWMAWPKQSSGVATDLREDVIRNAGLTHGLVDYKVCAIDATWSGLKFARRTIDRRKA
jgi:hypothetical protein